MLNTVDLKQIERKAYRSTYEDGLWDICIGVIVSAMAIFVHYPESGYSAINVIAFLIAFSVGDGLLIAGKKYITQPRMGQVRFGPVRQRKIKTLAIILGVIVFMQVILVGLTAIGWPNPALGETLLGDYDLERLLVASVGFLFVGIPMIVIAFINDFPRGYYIGVLMAMAVFLMILTNQPIYAIACGGLILVPGIVLFIRFLKKYPISRGDEINGSR